jgi:uncharacterized protein
MDTCDGERHRGFGNQVLRLRRPVAIALIATTLFMAYWAAHVPVASRFEDLFPAKHPGTLLYREFRRQYGGAQTLVLLLRVRHGDIFNFRTLRVIQDVTREVDALPGVNHNEVYSIASYRLLYARALPGELLASPFMYPKVPETQAELAALKSVILAHGQQLAGYITRDRRGALVIASFNEEGLDYNALFDGVQKIIARHQDANTRVYTSGAAMFVAWGFHYLPRILVISAVSIALMLIVLYLSLGQRSGWWAPIATGMCSAIWGLGFVGVMRFNFDPVMLVIPILLTARDLSHAIQWQGRYYDELDRGTDKMFACAACADAMLPPGLLAVLTSIGGVIFIATGDIPVLRQIGFGGAVWLGASLAMVFIMQPIVMSYLPRPQVRERSWLAKLHGAQRRADRRPFADWLARVPVTSGAPRVVMAAVGVCLLAAGIASVRLVPIGYQMPGTPIYRSDAKINQDTAHIGRFLPTDVAWVVVDTPGYPSPQSSVGTATLRMIDDLGNYLVSRGDAVAVLDFSLLATKPMNMLLHNGFPKYLALPHSDVLSANLWGFFFTGTAPDEVYTFFAQSPAMTNTCVRILLPDHTYSRLTRLRSDINQFVQDRVGSDPGLNKIRLRYVGGQAGLYLATDDVTASLNSLNLSLTLAAIFFLCCVVFRSVAAGVMFGVACVMANFVAFAFMAARNIGLTVDTIPVVSLGIGLGINFAIYTVARIRDEIGGGMTLNDAAVEALRTTGACVFSTFVVMVVGIVPWLFSPLLFHNEMSMLLILLMVTNVIVGLMILPAFIVWVRPRFVAGLEDYRPRAEAMARPSIS